MFRQKTKCHGQALNTFQPCWQLHLDLQPLWHRYCRQGQDWQPLQCASKGTKWSTESGTPNVQEPWAAHIVTRFWDACSAWPQSWLSAFPWLRSAQLWRSLARCQPELQDAQWPDWWHRVWCQCWIRCSLAPVRELPLLGFDFSHGHLKLWDLVTRIVHGVILQCFELLLSHLVGEPLFNLDQLGSRTGRRGTGSWASRRFPVSPRVVLLNGIRVGSDGQGLILMRQALQSLDTGNDIWDRLWSGRAFVAGESQKSIRIRSNHSRGIIWRTNQPISAFLASSGGFEWSGSPFERFQKLSNRSLGGSIWPRADFKLLGDATVNELALRENSSVNCLFVSLQASKAILGMEPNQMQRFVNRTQLVSGFIMITMQPNHSVHGMTGVLVRGPQFSVEPIKSRNVHQSWGRGLGNTDHQSESRGFRSCGTLAVFVMPLPRKSVQNDHGKASFFQGWMKFWALRARTVTVLQTREVSNEQFQWSLRKLLPVQWQLIFVGQEPDQICLNNSRSGNTSSWRNFVITKLNTSAPNEHRILWRDQQTRPSQVAKVKLAVRWNGQHT